jgi:hypothetical protein
MEWNWIRVTSGSPLEITQPQLAVTSVREHKWYTHAARSNLARFSLLQLNLNTLWCGKWCRLPGIAVSTSVQSKCCRWLCMSKCDVGFQFWSCGWTRVIAPVEVAVLLGYFSCFAVEAGYGFLCYGFIRGISHTKQHVHSCSSPYCAYFYNPKAFLFPVYSLAHEVADFVKCASYSIFFYKCCSGCFF